MEMELVEKRSRGGGGGWTARGRCGVSLRKRPSEGLDRGGGRSGAEEAGEERERRTAAQPPQRTRSLKGS